MAHPSQPQPQEQPPFFLLRIMEKVAKPEITATMRSTTMVPRFCVNQVIFTSFLGDLPCYLLFLDVLGAGLSSIKSKAATARTAKAMPTGLALSAAVKIAPSWNTMREITYANPH